MPWKPWIAVLLLCTVGMPCRAQSVISPETYRLRASMARCSSFASLKRVHDTAKSPDKLTELVFFARWLMVSPRSVTAARGVLETVPANEEEQSQFMQIMDAPDETTVADGDMAALEMIHQQWPELMARAVALAPDLLQNFVNYLPMAPNDIHSNFTASAAQVCKKSPAAFRLAFSALPEKDREYVHNKVFEAEHCQAIFVPEAE